MISSKLLMSGVIYLGIAGILYIKAFDIALKNESILVSNIRIDQLYNELLNNKIKSEHEIISEYINNNKIKSSNYMLKNYPYLYKRIIKIEQEKLK